MYAGRDPVDQQADTIGLSQVSTYLALTSASYLWDLVPYHANTTVDPQSCT